MQRCSRQNDPLRQNLLCFVLFLRNEGGQGEEGVQAEEVVQSAGVSLRAHGPVAFFFFFVSRPSLNGAVLPNCAYADISYCLAGVCSRMQPMDAHTCTRVRGKRSFMTAPRRTGRRVEACVERGECVCVCVCVCICVPHCRVLPVTAGGGASSSSSLPPSRQKTA